MTDVLITGASRGIGFALTREYLARGVRVFAGVRDPDRSPSLNELEANELVVVPVDRPFVYVIHDRGAGAILFIGRVLDPTDAP